MSESSNGNESIARKPGRQKDSVSLRLKIVTQSWKSASQICLDLVPIRGYHHVFLLVFIKNSSLCTMFEVRYLH